MNSNQLSRSGRILNVVQLFFSYTFAIHQTIQTTWKYTFAIHQTIQTTWKYTLAIHQTIQTTWQYTLAIHQTIQTTRKPSQSTRQSRQLGKLIIKFLETGSTLQCRSAFAFAFTSPTYFSFLQPQTCAILRCNALVSSFSLKARSNYQLLLDFCVRVCISWFAVNIKAVYLQSKVLLLLVFLF